MIRTRIDVENWKKSDVVAPRYDAWNAPGDAREAGAEREREELRPDGVDAHHLGGDLVLADGAPRPSHPRPLEVPCHDDGDASQRHPEVDGGDPGARAESDAEQCGSGSIGLIPSGPPVRLRFSTLMDRHPEDREGEGDRGEVLEEDRHDLAEPEGHDREVVAAQPEGRRTEQGTERRRDRHGQREDDPERQVDARGTRPRRSRRARCSCCRSAARRRTPRCRRRGRRRRRSRGPASPANPATMFRPMAMIAKIIMNVATVSSGTGSGKTLPAERCQHLLVEDRVEHGDDGDDREHDGAPSPRWPAAAAVAARDGHGGVGEVAEPAADARRRRP